mmetsp:Transcript_2047/g.6005  ORF Transcript_2047/g.6005 Transcript_2047/m.6005 type:complete len:201 (+) Transcript_2047:225-827(+)
MVFGHSWKNSLTTMSPMVVWIVACLPRGFCVWMDAATAASSLLGFSLKMSRPKSAVLSGGSRTLKRKKRDFLYAVARMMGSTMSLSCSVFSTTAWPCSAFFLIGFPWKSAMPRNLSVCSTLPRMRTSLFVWMFTILMPTMEGYTRKLPDSSKAACCSISALSFRISFSTAMRRPKSNLSKWRSDMFGSLCAAVNISRDSS